MKVFIYGTLKRGFPLFDKGLGGARYVGDVETVEPYPLYIAGSFYGPMMLERPGERLRVRGCSTSTKIGFKFSTKWKMSITNPAFAVLSQSRRSGEGYRQRQSDTRRRRSGLIRSSPTTWRLPGEAIRAVALR